MADYRVVQDPDMTGWRVRSRGQSRRGSHHLTRAAALRAARTLAEDSGGGELVIEDARGRVLERDHVRAPRRGRPGRRDATACAALLGWRRTWA